MITRRDDGRWSHIERHVNNITSRSQETPHADLIHAIHAGQVHKIRGGWKAFGDPA
jgi:hypothetical protein